VGTYRDIEPDQPLRIRTGETRITSDAQSSGPLICVNKWS
jgi:hypothetical protein